MWKIGSLVLLIVFSSLLYMGATHASPAIPRFAEAVNALLAGKVSVALPIEAATYEVPALIGMLLGVAGLLFLLGYYRRSLQEQSVSIAALKRLTGRSEEYTSE